MSLTSLSKAAFRAFTTSRDGPTLYDLCDPILLRPGGGDAHLRKFYKTALANPLLRPLLSRAGLPQLADKARLKALQGALVAARDEAEPDWAAIAAPLAALIEELDPRTHPVRRPAPEPGPVPGMAEIERMARACAAHLTGSYARNGFIPAYAAFNLVGDPDFRGRDLVTALTGLNARTYRNSTLLFNLARAFILGNPQVAALINPPWRGLSERMWAPVQIRHRSAYYDAFYCEALMDYRDSGLASGEEVAAGTRACEAMIRFCLETSREEVPMPDGEGGFPVVTALAPHPHSRLSGFFNGVKSDLGFGAYVPDCDTSACAFSAATQFGSADPVLDEPLIDFVAGYQVGRTNRHAPTVTINDPVAFEGGIVTWIENAKGERPFGNDLDPTLNLDVLEVSLRNLARWRILEEPRRLETLRRIVGFQSRLVMSGAFADPRSHIYYLPELYCAYFGRAYAVLKALPAAARAAVDPESAFEAMRPRVVAHVRDELTAREMNPFDAALALLALAKLGADPSSFAPALSCIAESFGEGRGRAPFKAYEWNKMKTPTRILVGGPEVTSAFVLSGLVHARRAMGAGGV